MMYFIFIMCVIDIFTFIFSVDLSDNDLSGA